MSSEVQGKQLNAQLEAGLADSVVEKAAEAEARARIASELANEAAIKAKESVARSAQATKELAQEAKRKAKGAKIAALNIKREAKLAARMVKKAKETENRATSRNGMTNDEEMNGKAALNGKAEQAKSNLDKELDPGSKEGVDKEEGSANGEARKEAEVTGTAMLAGAAASTAKETKWLSGDLFEGRVDILLQHSNAQELHSLEEILRSMQDLRVLVIYGSIGEGCRIEVLAEQPVPLIDILGRIPVVDEVTQFGPREIQLSLK